MSINVSFAFFNGFDKIIKYKNYTNLTVSKIIPLILIQSIIKNQIQNNIHNNFSINSQQIKNHEIKVNLYIF